jgi:hypothetical protein
MGGVVKIELPLTLLADLGQLAAYETEPLDSIVARILLATVKAEHQRQRKGWSNSGVFLPEGTRIKFVYNKDEYRGAVVGTEIEIGSARSDMPSKVVMDAVTERTGQEINLNGWAYLQAEIGGDWVLFRELRTKAQGTDS